MRQHRTTDGSLGTAVMMFLVFAIGAYCVMPIVADGARQVRTAMTVESLRTVGR